MINRQKIQIIHKKIGFLGLGIENYALIRYLLKHKLDCQMTICDARSAQRLGDKFKELKKYKNIDWRLGKGFNRRLYEFDLLMRSPGWPIFCPGVQEARKAKSGKLKLESFLYSPMKLFFDLCPTRNIIGVTGTKGKGTTSSLIYAVLKQGGRKAWLGGNIGVAPFSFIDKIKQDDWVVLELSSFHLEDMAVCPHIGVITNFYREHLAPADPHNPNYHKSLNKYWKAKTNMIRGMKRGDHAIVNKKLEYRISKLVIDPAVKIQKSKFKIHFFDRSDLISRLPGEHNKENIAAAEIAGKLAGISDSSIAKAVANFQGLEHRIEYVKDINGIQYFDDSFATTPENSIVAMRSFSAPIILLAGGADKGSDFRAMAREAKKRAKFVVLFEGQATPRIKSALLGIHYPASDILSAKSMKEAVALARSKASNGDIILMSPGCASFGMFKNYKDRGNQFQKEVVRK